MYKSALVWIDDVIVYAPSISGFLAALRKFFEVLRATNLTLSAAKSKVFESQTKWRGHLISGSGVRHDLERTNALRRLPLQATAADLQYLLCATNRLRESVIDYARVAEPLFRKLEASVGDCARRKSKLKNVTITWTDQEREEYSQFVGKICWSVPLALPSDDVEVCVFTDASDEGWAVVVTQVVAWSKNIPVHEEE